MLSTVLLCLGSSWLSLIWKLLECENIAKLKDVKVTAEVI